MSKLLKYIIFLILINNLIAHDCLILNSNQDSLNFASQLANSNTDLRKLSREELILHLIWKKPFVAKLTPWDLYESGEEEYGGLGYEFSKFKDHVKPITTIFLYRKKGRGLGRGGTRSDPPTPPRAGPSPLPRGHGSHDHGAERGPERGSHGTPRDVDGGGAAGPPRSGHSRAGGTRPHPPRGAPLPERRRATSQRPCSRRVGPVWPEAPTGLRGSPAGPRRSRCPRPKPSAHQLQAKHPPLQLIVHRAGAHHGRPEHSLAPGHWCRVYGLRLVDGVLPTPVPRSERPPHAPLRGRCTPARVVTSQLCNLVLHGTLWADPHRFSRSLHLGGPRPRGGRPGCCPDRTALGPHEAHPRTLSRRLSCFCCRRWTLLRHRARSLLPCLRHAAHLGSGLRLLICRCDR